MRNLYRYFLLKIYSILFLKDKISHLIQPHHRKYGEFKATLSRKETWLKHLIAPGRLIQYLKVKLWVGRFFYAIEPVEQFAYEIVNNDPRLSNALSDLNCDGIAIIKNYFDDSTCDHLEKIVNNNNRNNFNEDPRPSEFAALDQKLVDVWCDKGLHSLIQVFSKAFMYSRYYPHQYSIFPNFDTPATASDKYKISDSYAYRWHYDHVNLLTFSVMLHNIDIHSTHMQALAGGNRFLNTIIDIGDANLSDETIEHFNARIIPCVGTRGTVYLHTGNVWHRIYLKKGSPRKIIAFDFSPGFNILLDSKAIAKSLRNNYDLDSMTPRQRKILSGLFPQTPFKGFRLTNNEFKQMNYKGV